MRRPREPADRRITLYLRDGAVGGRVLAVYATGVSAVVEGPVPPYERHRYSLHLPGLVLAGDLVCLTQEERLCRLQFLGLTAADYAALAPWREDEP
jgi:hypothetical protein